MTNTRFVVVGIILLLTGGIAYSYTSSLLPPGTAWTCIMPILVRTSGTTSSTPIFIQCQQAQDYGTFIIAAVPLSAVLAVLRFMLAILGSFMVQKPKIAQLS